MGSKAVVNFDPHFEGEPCFVEPLFFFNGSLCLHYFIWNRVAEDGLHSSALDGYMCTDFVLNPLYASLHLSPEWSDVFL